MSAQRRVSTLCNQLSCQCCSVPSKPLYGCHLVGSLGLDDAESVFTTCSEVFGPLLRRIPDGETGPSRRLWVFNQRTMMAKMPEVDQERTKIENLICFKRGVNVAALRLRTGYVEYAKESWEVFSKLKGQGKIPQGTRFQVCLATPYVLSSHVHPDYWAEAFIAYEREVYNNVEEICAAIPHEHLSIQFDVCYEVIVSEGEARVANHMCIPDISPAAVADAVRRVGLLVNAVPPAVETGLHLCYGTAGSAKRKTLGPETVDEACVVQNDMGTVVRITNGVQKVLRRPLNFVHLPVSNKDALDNKAFFDPLAELDPVVKMSTEIYIGLIGSGMRNERLNTEADLRRIKAAQAVLPNFGIALECGLGRAKDEVLPILKSHITALEAAN